MDDDLENYPAVKPGDKVLMKQGEEWVEVGIVDDISDNGAVTFATVSISDVYQDFISQGFMDPLSIYRKENKEKTDGQ